MGIFPISVRYLHQSIVVSSGISEQRIDRYLRRLFPLVPLSHIHGSLRKGNISLIRPAFPSDADPKVATAAANDRVSEGYTMLVPEEWLAPKAALDEVPSFSRSDEKVISDLKESIIYMDRDIIAFNKPAGLAVQGGSTLGMRHLDAYLPAFRFGMKETPRLVHRLDRDTSGVLVLARNHATSVRLSSLFAGKSRAEESLRKKYWALCWGIPQPRRGRLRLPLLKIKDSLTGERRMTCVEQMSPHAQTAVTEYEVMDSSLRDMSWIELLPITGRQHQLRVHCAEGLNVPIVGDSKYGARARGVKRHLHETEAEDDILRWMPDSNMLFLHARSLFLPLWKANDPQQSLAEGCGVEPGGLLLVAPLPRHMLKAASSLRPHLNFLDSEMNMLEKLAE